MTKLLLPRATAAWLVDNTRLTFRQIAQVAGLHELEVQALADGEGGVSLHPVNPIANGQITPEEITRCEDDPTAHLQLKDNPLMTQKTKKKGAKYTPLSKRGDKPDAIAWLVKFYPQMSDGQISKLIGTTKNTITKIRDRTHWNMQNIKPQNPVDMGLCSFADLNQITKKLTPAVVETDDDARHLL
ncbi:MAG: cell cycle transcriptional regulator TrcR [Alphaproteobacteria bacterium]